MKHLISKSFDSKIFKDRSDCVICLDEFISKPEDADADISNDPKWMVTPLPCDKSHIYHTDCIK